jgi:hypothetical protein
MNADDLSNTERSQMNSSFIICLQRNSLLLFDSSHHIRNQDLSIGDRLSVHPFQVDRVMSFFIFFQIEITEILLIFSQVDKNVL